MTNKTHSRGYYTGRAAEWLGFRHVIMKMHGEGMISDGGQEVKMGTTSIEETVAITIILY